MTAGTNGWRRPTTIGQRVTRTRGNEDSGVLFRRFGAAMTDDRTNGRGDTFSDAYAFTGPCRAAARGL